jgi:hypothetical protein
MADPTNTFRRVAYARSGVVSPADCVGCVGCVGVVVSDSPLEPHAPPQSTTTSATAPVPIHCAIN